MGGNSTRLEKVRTRIAEAEYTYARAPGSVRLLAVSKTRTAAEVRDLFEQGQESFGESYLQEAIGKIESLGASKIEWHFIGRIQGNKTKSIAEHFDWVHSLADPRHARRLNDQRPSHLPPLNVCLQINISEEPTKAGLTPEAAADLAGRFQAFPGLRLCGLMAIPALTEGLENQRRPFADLRTLRDRLATPALPLETLSMGMSADLEAAIAEGATLVRIGTAIFGPRSRKAVRE